MKTLIAAVAILLASSAANADENERQGLLGGISKFFESDDGNSTFTIFDPDTNSFKNGTITNMGGGQKIINTYDFGTQKFGTTIIQTTPTHLQPMKRIGE